MNIVLTQKDADSILCYLREQVEDINSFQKEVTEQFAEFENIYNKSIVLQQKEECKEMLEENREQFDRRMKEIGDERSKLYRFIEMLTCGSEVSA